MRRLDLIRAAVVLRAPSLRGAKCRKQSSGGERAYYFWIAAAVHAHARPTFPRKREAMHKQRFSPLKMGPRFRADDAGAVKTFDA
jgi:hypothetical protein